MQPGHETTATSPPRPRNFTSRPESCRGVEACEKAAPACAPLQRNPELTFDFRRDVSAHECAHWNHTVCLLSQCFVRPSSFAHESVSEETRWAVFVGLPCEKLFCQGIAVRRSRLQRSDVCLPYEIAWARKSRILLLLPGHLHDRSKNKLYSDSE